MTTAPPGLPRHQTGMPELDAIDHDAVQIAKVEVRDLDHPDPATRRLAIATLSQVLHQMQLADPLAAATCARLTHSNGRLIQRYQSGDPS